MNRKKGDGISSRGLLFPLLVEVEPSEETDRRGPGDSGLPKIFLEGSLLVLVLRRAIRGLQRAWESSAVRRCARWLAGALEGPRALAVLFLYAAGATVLFLFLLPASPGPPSLFLGAVVRIFLLLAALVGAGWVLSGTQRE